MLQKLTILLAFTFFLPASALAGAPGLQKEISATLNQKNVSQSNVGIYAVDVASGDVIYALKSNKPFNPASNVKLVTSAAALVKFGPSYTVSTRVSAEGLKDGIVTKALYIKGDGDPYLLYEDMVKWAVTLKRRGITKVDGDILVDDTTFDPGYMPPGFDQKKEDASYRAPIGAVSVNFNAVTVSVEPGELGKAPKISLYPPNSHVVVENKARTKKGKRNRIGVKSITTKTGTTIKVTGSIGMKSKARGWRKRIDEPSLFAGSVFKTALEDIGIQVTGKVDKGIRPAKTRSLILHESKPLQYHLTLMNKWSNNFMAEQIFRLLGTQGTDVKIGESYEAIAALFKEAGITTKYKVMNGSGLYTGNTFTPKQIVAVLRFMANHRYGPEYMSTLPIAAEDGTLRKRLKGAPSEGQTRGKTGTLNEVTALSGYIRSPSGKLIAYCILFNDTPVKAWLLRKQQDQIAQAIAKHAP